MVGLKSGDTVVAERWSDKYNQCYVGDWDLDE